MLKQDLACGLQIRQYEEKIPAPKHQIEDLIMCRITDRSRAEFYSSVIEKLKNKSSIVVNTARSASKQEPILSADRLLGCLLGKLYVFVVPQCDRVGRQRL